MTGVNNLIVLYYMHDDNLFTLLIFYKIIIKFKMRLQDDLNSVNIYKTCRIIFKIATD